MGKRKNKNQDKKKKVALVFDESKRKDFLCGFRKRKLERKKKAQEELQRMLKEEKKRIKQENKESYKKLVVSSRPIPDIEQLLQEEYEDDDVNVKIVELSSDTLQKKNLFIGENKPAAVKSDVNKEIKKKKEEHIEHVPGMGSDEEEEEEESEKEDDKEKVTSKKDLKRILKRQATTKIQKSKVFQMKSKLDRVQNRKKTQKKDQRKERNMKHRGTPRNKEKSKGKVGKRSKGRKKT